MIKPDEFFHLLSDETRLRCLMLLEAKGELCVCDLTATLKMIQPKISRHLAILRKSGIVLDNRKGVWIYYKINPKLPEWARKILKTNVKHVTMKPYATDLVLINNLKQLNCNNT